MTPLCIVSLLLDAGNTRLLDESTILRFRHLLKTHQLAPQILATVNTLLTKQGLLLKSGTALNSPP
jgi:IS5 family transposase